jgi:hypothetical protein
MEVRSKLADMSVQIGAVRRDGAELVLTSSSTSSIDAEIRVSAREAVCILARILASAGGLAFILLIPVYVWKRVAPRGTRQRASDINKPW